MVAAGALDAVSRQIEIHACLPAHDEALHLAGLSVDDDLLHSSQRTIRPDDLSPALDAELLNALVIEVLSALCVHDVILPRRASLAAPGLGLSLCGGGRYQHSLCCVPLARHGPERRFESAPQRRRDGGRPGAYGPELLSRAANGMRWRERQPGR